MDIVNFPAHHLKPHQRGQISSSCVHDHFDLGGIVLDVCPDSGDTLWSDEEGILDSAIAMARLFGGFDLVSAVPGLASPAPTILAYRPDSRRGKSAMRALPLRRWVAAAPGLFITHDGDLLLMAPTDPILTANLARDI